MINNTVKIWRQNDDGSLPTYRRFYRKILDGKAFSVSHRFEAVAADGVIQLLFENPSASGKNIYVVAIEIVSTGKFWVNIYRENTVSASGTSLTPTNLNLGSVETSVVNAEYGGTYTAGSLVHQTVSPGGSGIRAIGSLAEVGENIIIPPNNNILIEAINKSASAEDMSIRILWWEE